MNILLWIIFGGIAGWIASLIVGGGGLGILGDIIVGIVGAVIGGWIAGMTGSRDAEHPATVSGFVWAVVGAIVLLLIINLIFH
jgi:uncharacterized membrane protein YeaQ/YmgE (transglycosylase-associated protein family)